jgi:hypothetical protein
MNRGGATIADIERLLDLSAEHCNDRNTFDDLLATVGKPERWKLAHGLFQRIRTKSLAVGRASNVVGTAQYMFEEACAKTLYNLSGESAPFDSDSHYWVVPNAIAFGRTIGIEEPTVLAAVSLAGMRGAPTV